MKERTLPVSPAILWTIIKDARYIHDEGNAGKCAVKIAWTVAKNPCHEGGGERRLNWPSEHQMYRQ